MTRKRMVGPRSDGDFAMSIGMGGGRLRKGASVVKKDRRKKQRKQAKPETSMKTKRKATRTRSQLKRLEAELEYAKYKKDQKTGAEYWSKGTLMKKSPDNRERANIEGKGGLRSEVKTFRQTLDKQDKADTNAVKAYRFLQKSKYNQLKKGDEGYRDSKFGGLSTSEKTRLLQQQTRHALSYNNFKENVANPKDPTIRKVIRKNKKAVKEQFKEQIKKERAERKLDKTKKRRRKN
jgi:hypothetical protein